MMSKFLKSGFLTLLERGSGLVFAFGTAFLLLRGLSKAEFAAWGMFTLIGYFVEMGRSGLLQNGLVSFLASAKNDDEKGKIQTASAAINLIFSVVTIAFLIAGAGAAARFFDFPELEKLLPIFAATSLALAPMYHFNFVQQANFQFTGIFWASFFYRGSLFAAAIWQFFHFDKALRINDLAWAMFVGAATGAAISFFFARRFLLFGSLDFEWMKKLVAYGRWVLGTNLATQFYKNADKMALGKMLGADAFAIYDAAGKITQMIEVPSFSVAQVVFPESARRLAAEGAGGVRELYEKSVGAILALIFPALVGVLVFAEPIIIFFAGEKYIESAGVLRLTAFFGLFMPYAVQFGTILDSTGRPRLNFLVTLGTAILNLVLAILFIKSFGLFGAAFATLAGYLLSFFVMQRILHNSFKINWLAPIFYAFSFYGKIFSLVKKRVVGTQI